MCGIAGILTLAPVAAAEAEARVHRMLPALDHRGPDGRGVWSAATATGHAVAFGHTRLAIIDLSDGGRQPMADADTAVTYNGEIYNHRSLRAKLESAGLAFKSSSDTEVLLAAHSAWGDRCVEHLDGMFAFGLWNGKDQRLLLGRDRFGIKPLYYYRSATHFVFASEIRALLASGLVDAAIDEEAIWHYVGYQTTPTPTTLIRGVRMLEPGHVMSVAPDGRTSVHRYWDLLEAAAAEAVPASIDDARARITTLLQEAVHSNLVSDVPVGLFLSGGIDSGALVSTLASAGVRPQTFTVALDEAAFDESNSAASVARRFGTAHTEIRLRERDLLDELPAMLAATDHPSGDAVNTYAVAKAVSDRGLKVALSGLGGDEIFGGYASFGRLGRMAPAAAHLGLAPRAVRRAAATLVRAAGGGGVAAEKAAAVLDSEGSLAEMWPVTRQLFSSQARHDMLSARIAPAGDAYSGMLAAAFARSGVTSTSAHVSYAESRAYMHDVLLRDTDQMSMAHALEVRVPLLDHRLAAFVVALPDAWKIQPGIQKPLLQGSLTQPLPDEIAGAPKRGFALPFDTWMRGALRPYCETQLGERGLDGRGLLKPGAARRLWTRFLERAPGVTWSRVWTLIALNAWLERRSL